MAFVANPDSRTSRSRARILDAAEVIFRETGYETVTVRAIAVRAGLTRKTVYNHFVSKEAIADEVIALSGAQAERLYGPAILSREPALNILTTILSDSAKWSAANPDLARRALLPRNRPTVLPARKTSFQGVVIDAIRLGQSQGVIRRDEDAGFRSLVQLGLYAQAMLSALDADEPEWNDVKRIVRIVVEGIGVR